MKYLRQFLIILLVYFIGEVLHQFLHIPIPGNVLGMILLFLGLCAGVIKVEMIEDVSNFLLDHLSFFFVPAGVGLITSFSVLKGTWFALLCICVISTMLVMVVTGYTVKLLKRRD